MRRSFKKISAEMRAKILLDLEVSGSSPYKIAKRYNVSRGTIYLWQKQARDLAAKTSSVAHGIETKNSCSAANFIEVPILDQASGNFEPENFAYTPQSKLSKASLVFNDCSIVLEGAVPTSSLIAIIQILEKGLC
jgi:transposase-like protein